MMALLTMTTTRPPLFASGGHAAPALAAKSKQRAVRFGDKPLAIPRTPPVASDLLLTTGTKLTRQLSHTSPAHSQA
jgi:hypothetical protein